VNILAALDDPKIFARHFRGTSWNAWRAFLCALFGLPMSDDQLAIYRQCTERTDRSTQAASEGWLCCGRRAGKSFALALIAVFLACFRDWRSFLSPGEVATVMVISADRRQARTITRYVVGLLQATPMLKRQIESMTVESVTLKNRVVIEVHTASFRTVRGYTVVAALCDEIAFWTTDEDAAAPDVEVLNALRPSMSTVPGAVLLCASSPHARRGALWEAHRKHFGRDGDPILVWQAPTRAMNPSVPQSLIDEAMADDPARASAEYLAQFRSDVAAFVDRAVVEACVAAGVRERAPAAGIEYHGFVDPSDGSASAMAVAIGHRHADGCAVLDVTREVRPPFSPEAVVGEFAALLKSYGISTVFGDRFAGEWARQAFGVAGIRYELAASPRSDLYRDALPLLNSRKALLLDDGRLVAQLCALERRAGRGGRDAIGPPPNALDDVANAAAGVLTLAANAQPSLWQVTALLSGGRPLELPRGAEIVFAVVATGEREGGAAFFALSQDRTLYVVDVDAGPLRDVMTGLHARLVDLHAHIRTSGGVTAIYASGAVAAELVRLGYAEGAVQVVDRMLADPLLHVSAATHVAVGQVKICDAATRKNFPLNFLVGGPAKPNDPLAVAVHAGIAVALDQNRELAA
jgi:hypothetical protein